MTDQELVANALRSALSALATDPMAGPTFDRQKLLLDEISSLNNRIRDLCEFFEEAHISVHGYGRDDATKFCRKLRELGWEVGYVWNDERDE